MYVCMRRIVEIPGLVSRREVCPHGLMGLLVKVSKSKKCRIQRLPLVPNNILLRVDSEIIWYYWCESLRVYARRIPL